MNIVVTQSLRMWMVLALLVGTSSSWAQPSGVGAYKTLSLKTGLYRMEQGDEGWHVSAGEAASAGVGFSVLPILSLEMVGNVWYPREQEHYDFEFAGISLGSNVLLHFPNEGPYVKFGRHCWRANVFNAINLWDGSGCSNMLGGGILFGRWDSGYFFEASRIRYRDVDSWFFTGGVRF